MTKMTFSTRYLDRGTQIAHFNLATFVHSLVTFSEASILAPLPSARWKEKSSSSYSFLTQVERSVS